MELHKIVKKLEKKMGKIITFADIQELVDPVLEVGEVSEKRVAQVVYALKGKGIIQNIRNGIYLVVNPSLSLTQIDIVHTYYWDIVRQMIIDTVGKDYSIGGEKAMELLLLDFSPPSKLIVYTKDIQKKILVAPGYEILFRTLATGKKSGQINAFSRLKKKSLMLSVQGVRLTVLEYHAALLDGLTLHTHDVGIEEGSVLRFLKRYHTQLDRDTLGMLVSIRYIRAINRLRTLAKTHGYHQVYEICLDIIKKEGGGCFVSI